jgi:hypothetical protein
MEDRMEHELLRLRDEIVTWREIDGELVVLETEHSRYLTANPAGTLLWRRLAEGSTRDVLVRALVEAYDVPVDIAGRDVDRFVAEVRSEGLLAA